MLKKNNTAELVVEESYEGKLHDSEVSEGMKVCLCSTQLRDTMRHMSGPISITQPSLCAHTLTHTCSLSIEIRSHGGEYIIKVIT